MKIVVIFGDKYRVGVNVPDAPGDPSAQLARLEQYAAREFSDLVDGQPPKQRKSMRRMVRQTVRGWLHSARALELDDATAGVAPLPEVDDDDDDE